MAAAEKNTAKAQAADNPKAKVAPKSVASKEPPPATAVVSTPPKAQKLIGSTATSVFAGYYSEEYHQELSGKQAYDTYDEMRRSDAQVKLVLSSIKNPLKSARYHHEPVDDTDEAIKIAKFLDWHWFQNPFFGWGQTLTEILTYLEFGHSVHEYTFKVYPQREFGLVHIVGAMAFRKQKSIERWRIEPEKGLVGVDQYAYGDTVREGAQNVFIPRDRLCIFVNEQEGDNYEGISLLRAAYGAWFRKNHLLKMLMIGAEKAAIGTPIGIYNNAGGDEQRKLFEDILQSFVVHESSYLMAPQGYEVEIVKNDFDADKLMAAIAYEDAQMSRSILFQFLELGQNGNGGAFALGSTLLDMAMSTLQFVGNGICEKLRKINEKLVEWNFGDPDLTPKTVCTGINQKAGTDLATALKSYVDAGVLRPDDKLETYVRETYNLPKFETTRAEDDEKAKKEREANPPPVPGVDPNQPPGPGQKVPPPADGKTKPPPFNPVKKFSDLALPAWEPFRPLTVYEQPLNLSEMAAELAVAGDFLSLAIRTQVRLLADRVHAALEKKVGKDPASLVKAAAAIQIDTDAYRSALLREMARTVAMGSRQAARDLAAKASSAQFAESFKSDLEFLPPHVQEALKKQAEAQVESDAAVIRKILDMTVVSGQGAGVDGKQVASDVEDRLNDFVESNRLDAAARTIAAQANNMGRNGFFFAPENVKQIRAFQYSAILDSRTTDICLSLDGKIFKPNDPAADRYRPPNHHGCRSILIPITLNEPTPTVTGLEVDPTNSSLVDEYRRRGRTPPDLATIKKSRNL